MNSIQEVPLLVRREVEARFASSLLNEFAEELGWEKTIEITRKAVSKMALAAGEETASQIGSTFDDFKRIFPHFADDPAVTADLNVSENETCLRMDVTRCQYAEMYQKLGLESLGRILSCERDPSFFEGLSSEIEFSREHTILGGDEVCDFCMRSNR